MIIQIYMGGYKTVEKSGVGRAILHQREMLRQAGVETTDKSEKAAKIIHINTVFPNSVIAALSAKMQGKHVVWYGHSTMEDFKNSFRGSNTLAPLFRRWIIFCYGLGDIVITPTPYSERLLKSYGIKKPVYNLTNGIDTGFFRPDAEARTRFRKRFNIDGDVPVVISVGHFMARKGLPEFVSLARSMPDFRFIWFGHTDRSLVPKDVLAAIDGAPANLSFPGYNQPPELRDAYCGADVFAFMSREETEGIVVLEALACGIPVVVRDIPVYDGWLENGANVYKARDNDGFVHIISGLTAHTLPSLKEAALETARQRDMQTTGMRLKEIYAEAFPEIK